MQKFAVHFYAVSCGRLRAEVRANFAVNDDAARGNEFVAIAARTNACGGEETIEAHGKLQELKK